MRQERLVNKVTTTLDGAINDSVTTITVADGGVFPTEGDFRLLINDEIVLVTARSTHDLTVERGAEGSTAASHADGDDVDTIVTKGGLDAVINQVTAGALHRPAHRLLDINGNVLTSSSFSWVSQGSSSVTDEPDGSVSMAVAETSGGYRLQMKSAPTAPYTVRTRLSIGLGNTWSSSGSIIGATFRESSTGRLVISYYEIGEDCRPARYTDENTFSAYIASANNAMADNQWVWFELEDDNTDIFLRYSTDGVNFFTMGTESRTAFLTSGPDQVGWGCVSRGRAGKVVTLTSWSEE